MKEFGFLSLAVIFLACGSNPSAVSTSRQGSGLPVPREITFDDCSSPGRAEAAVLAARRFYGFWNSGDTRLLNAALAPTFIDRTLPAGRPQGPEGPAFASTKFRAAVPDLQCEIQQLVLGGDRVVAHLRFRGRFTGHFGEKRGGGEPIDFIATDILRIVNGQITDNWHIEDNLALLSQLGVVTP